MFMGILLLPKKKKIWRTLYFIQIAVPPIFWNELQSEKTQTLHLHFIHKIQIFLKDPGFSG